MSALLFGLLLVILGFLILAYEIKNFTTNMLIGFAIFVLGLWILATKFRQWVDRH